MKLFRLFKENNNGATRFLLAGVIISATALLSNSLIPWQVKLGAGIMLVVYGFYLLIKGDAAEPIKRGNKFGKTNSRGASKLVFVLAIGVMFATGAFYYMGQSRPPKKKEFTGQQGQFEIQLGNKKYPGTARVDGQQVMLQFTVSPGLQIKSISLANIPALQNAGMGWICALNKDFGIVACSSDLATQKGFSEQFFDEGYFTIGFQFREVVKIENIENLAFSIVTNHGNQGVTIHKAEE